MKVQYMIIMVRNVFFKILKGVMLEKKYQISGNNLNLTDDKVINESTTSFLEKNDDIHQVKNIHNNFTITLHLYVPFYQKTNIYKINQVTGESTLMKDFAFPSGFWNPGSSFLDSYNGNLFLRDSGGTYLSYNPNTDTLSTMV